jgi:threonine dehydratase
MKIEEAYKRIHPHILKTPLFVSDYVNKITKANVFFKLENLQWTGSFKLRGALNKILKLNTDEKDNGVVAYSSGNHGQAVAYASKINQIKAKIIMPKNAPLIKIKNTKKYGAEVILYNPATENREEMGNKLAKEKSYTLIKPYDDFDIIAGQGTSGKEIAEKLINLKIKPDIYLCCCGGGGLIAGTSTYLKYKFPKISCYSVEPEAFNDTEVSLNKNLITPIKKGSKSICDALLATQPGNITFPINRKILNGGFSVSDYEVKKTIIQLSENIKIIAEPGGAVAAAALLNNKIEIKNKTIVVMISGGNIDRDFFSKIVKEF